MCYSAQIEATYKRYVRMFGANISLRDFADLYLRREREKKIKLPRAIDSWFSDPQSDVEREICAVIERYDAAQTTLLEQEMFEQRARLVKAESALAVKPTKAATESQRIAENKIKAALRRLDAIRRTEPSDSDARIFPGTYAPVLVMEDGQRVIKPMRYQCRPAGKPAFYDTKFPGTYNARRDNLEGFWKGVFGRTHGLMLVNVFYENVSRPDGNVVLEFRPNTGEPMLVACLWSHWTGKEEPDLLSFAAITDEPPPEVAAAGHDRCIVPIKPEHIDAWLNPDPSNLEALYAILDDRERPYYEHRLAA